MEDTYNYMCGEKKKNKEDEEIRYLEKHLTKENEQENQKQIDEMEMWKGEFL